MTILVDTSVWIRFLAGNEPYAAGLDQILQNGDVLGHPMVFGELLMGDVGGGRSTLLEAYKLMRQAHAVPHAEVVDFVNARHLTGRGIGWIDVHLLASALVTRCPLWTADGRLHAAATELGVSYQHA